MKVKTVGIDATTLEANAALRSIVRRDTGESYHDFLAMRAQALRRSERFDLIAILSRAFGRGDDFAGPFATGDDLSDTRGI